MSDLMHFTEHTLHTLALGAMGLIYTIRLIWLFKRFKGGKERQPATGPVTTTRRKGILYSWAIVAMPWAMESQRKNFLFYCSFVIFHLGVAAAITLSIFLIPYLPWVLTYEWIVLGLQIVIGASFVIGVLRIIRRIGSVYMRALSTPDDYFSLILLTVWFGFGFFAVPNDYSGGEWHLITFFIMTSFLLVYVPFSKISHYLYYPFTRYWLGKSLGHRGVFPMERGKRAGAASS